jgi:hypothetical protein
MATVPAIRVNFTDLQDDSIQKIFSERLAEKPLGMEKIFNVKDSNSYYNKDSYVVGLDKAQYVADNASAAFDAPIQGYDKTYTSKKYATIVEVSEYCTKFGFDYRKIGNQVINLADALSAKVEDDAFDMLNNSYSTSYADGTLTVSTAGGDSAAFFSASHTREDGKRSAVKPIPCFA